MSTYMGCDKVEITLRNHEHYATKDDILEEIEHNKLLIEECKQKIFGMICGNIKDLFNTTDLEGSPMDPIDIAMSELNRLFGSKYEDYGLINIIEHNVDLQYIADNWEKRWDEASGYGFNNISDEDSEI